MEGDPTGDLVIKPFRGVSAGIRIPAAELRERFSRSPGPGGQSVNTADSRVELLWDISSSAAITDDQRTRLLDALGNRAANGVVTVVATEHRSQLRNRLAARTKLAALIRRALIPSVPRRPTRPSSAAVERRLTTKRRRAEIKARRQPPATD
jgi:ribosome-associated protein